MARQLLCPSCSLPLSVGVSTDGKTKVVSIYCGYGPCPTYEMNDGGAGPNLESAYVELVRKYQEWLGQHPEP